ncbi:hypothetical protein BaRGS_00038514 [Batillaria attramentaria]|uniref:gamma-glutamylcyclotransferase n=1 Tax=Batillaria attramentaria TaxID=370345 RepID=A0ABD0J708_9CAEN
MTSGTFLYFAYGSNLLRERLLIHNPSAVFECVARLDDYCFGFCGESRLWHGGVATIFKRPGRHVWGVVWRLNVADRDILDWQESTYNPKEVGVVAIGDRVLRCRTYVRRGHSSKPSPQYKNVVVTGAEQNRLPEEYIQSLRSFTDNGFQGDIPVYSQIMKEVRQQNVCV